MNAHVPRKLGFGLAILLLFGLVGCAGPKIDWAARIGNYTFDQAVLELGPPDKQAKLQDGTLVADWLTRRGYAQTYGGAGYMAGTGVPYGYYGPFYAGNTTVWPDRFLRLVFGSDGKLKDWKRYAR